MGRRTVTVRVWGVPRLVASQEGPFVLAASAGACLPYRQWWRQPPAKVDFALRRKTSYLGILAAAGIATGALVGVLAGNFGLWLAVGLILGLITGALLDARSRPGGES